MLDYTSWQSYKKISNFVQSMIILVSGKRIKRLNFWILYGNQHIR